MEEGGAYRSRRTTASVTVSPSSSSDLDVSSTEAPDVTTSSTIMHSAPYRGEGGISRFQLGVGGRSVVFADGQGEQEREHLALDPARLFSSSSPGSGAQHRERARPQVAGPNAEVFCVRNESSIIPRCQFPSERIRTGSYTPSTIFFVP